MPHSIHQNTPCLTVIDGRGLTTRQVAYHRANANDATQARVKLHRYDAAGRLVASWDPRFFALREAHEEAPPNFTNVVSLSAARLASDGVDAGWQVAFFAEAGNALESWDSRDTHWRTDYDHLLRPTVIHEQADGQASRATECFTYADSSPEMAALNLCGRLICSEDDAGRHLVQGLGLAGQTLRETRHFLMSLDLPNWPEEQTARDQLLEPGDGLTTTFGYSPCGEMLFQIDALANKQAFDYDVSGLLKRVGLTMLNDTYQPLLHDLEYSAFGHVESQTAGNGLVSKTTIDPASGRLDKLTTTRRAGDELQHLRYGYDPAGNVLSIEDGAQPTRHFANQQVQSINTYAYDSLYQLIKATGRETVGASIRPELPELALLPVDASQFLNYTQHYQYDDAGSLIELKHQGHQSYTRTLMVDEGSNRALPLGEGERPPDFNVQFDACGNLQTLTPGQALTWDARNQLIQINLLTREDGEHDAERYAYDGAGQRLRKTAVARAKSVVHTRETRYLPGLEIRTSTVNDECLQVVTVQSGRCAVRCLRWSEGKPDDIQNDQLRYNIGDHLDCVTLELDADALLISQEGYYPFGGTAWWAAKSAIEASYKTIRYSGMERDASGLYYYGLRYYAPWLQRWISPDPGGSANDLNRYRMVENGPMNRVDLLGLDGFDVTTATAIATVIAATLLAALGLVRRKSNENAREARAAFFEGKKYQYTLTNSEVEKLSIFVGKFSTADEKHFEFNQGNRGQIHAFYIGNAEHRTIFDASKGTPALLANVNSAGIPTVDLRGKTTAISTPGSASGRGTGSLASTGSTGFLSIFEGTITAEEKAEYRRGSSTNSNKRGSTVRQADPEAVSTPQTRNTSNTPGLKLDMSGFFVSKAFLKAKKDLGPELKPAIDMAVEKFREDGTGNLHESKHKLFSLDLTGVGNSTGRGAWRLMFEPPKKGVLKAHSVIDPH